MADNKIKVRVGFDYTGDDGEQRTAGAEVTITQTEYLRRGPQGDGFAREIGGRSGRAGDPGDPARAAELPAGTTVPVLDPTQPAPGQPGADALPGVVETSGDSSPDATEPEKPKTEQGARPAKATAGKRTSAGK